MAERLDQFLEQHTAEKLALTNTAAIPVQPGPTGNVISMPVTDGAGPDIVNMARSRRGDPSRSARIHCRNAVPL
jgi:hypothetical protein